MLNAGIAGRQASIYAGASAWHLYKHPNDNEKINHLVTHNIDVDHVLRIALHRD